MPLLGAYMADEHWGRYKTICISIVVAIVGHITLVISAIPPVITNQSACFGVFMLGLIIMGLGTGGFKPNISPLVVEQIPLTTIIVKSLASGENVIVDPTITQSRIYHYFYLFINIGALIGQIGMVYAEKYVGFWLSFLLPTIAFLLTPLIMWWGRKRYRQKPPSGSVASKAFKVVFLALRGRWSINPYLFWKNTHDGTMWASVKPSNIPRDQQPAWMTFDDAWVDEIRRGFAACAVFTWYPLYWLTYGQLTNNFTQQATTMTLNGVPNDVVSNLDPLALIIFIPICDQFLYPGLEKWASNSLRSRRSLSASGFQHLPWSGLPLSNTTSTRPHIAATTPILARLTMVPSSISTQCLDPNRLLRPHRLLGNFRFHYLS